MSPFLWDWLCTSGAQHDSYKYVATLNFLQVFLCQFYDFFFFKKLEELEKEEELRTAAGEYDSDSESEDEEMMEIRQLAKQIREKKKLKILQSKEKNTQGPRMPRTAKKVSLGFVLLILSSNHSSPSLLSYHPISSETAWRVNCQAHMPLLAASKLSKKLVHAPGINPDSTARFPQATQLPPLPHAGGLVWSHADFPAVDPESMSPH